LRRLRAGIGTWLIHSSFMAGGCSIRGATS
jgi:hypothetical protein